MNTNELRFLSSLILTVIWIGVALLVLFTEFVNQFLPNEPSWILPLELFWIALFVTLHALVLAPFDIFSGYYLSKREGSCFRLGEYLGRYGKSVIRHALIMALVFFSILQVGKLHDRTGVMVFIGGLLLLALFFQVRVANFIGFFKLERGGRGEVYFADGPSRTGFTGGVAGFPFLEKIILPKEAAANEESQVQKQESYFLSRSRIKGVLIPYFWNLYGFWSASLFAGADVVSIGGMLKTVMAFSIWCFLGQILLAGLTKSGFFEADHYFLSHGGSRDFLEQTIRTWGVAQFERPSESRLLKSLSFIPTSTQRLENLGSQSGFFGAFDAYHFMQYFSWICLSPLSRVDMRTLGRPERWVISGYA